MKLYEKMQNGVYVIAEMSANHAGKIENAFQIIEEAAEAGADCVKIQTYTADTLTIDCDEDAYHLKGGLWDGYNYYQLYKEAYTPWEWQKALKEKCEEVGVDFLSTPFDRTAVDFLEDLGVEFYKIASFELVDIPLIEYTASKGKPIVMSCGMGSVEEIEEALAACRRQGNENVVLLKCCSEYPAQYGDMNVSVIADMKQRFGVPVGLSDHSMGSLAPVVAVAMGAQVVEKHVCLSREIENPDAGFSMEMDEFARMVQDVRNAYLIKGKVTYELTEHEKNSLNCRRSLVAVKSIAKGELFTAENVRSIRPAIGIKPKYYHKLLGKEAGKDYRFGEPIGIDELGEEAKGRTELLRKATEADMERLFRWTNDSQVRQASFQTEEITWETHAAWFGQMMRDDNVCQFIYEQDGVPIGQVRLNREGQTARISYSIAKEHRGRGNAKRMLGCMEKEVQNVYPEIQELIAEVKWENMESRSVFEQLGYGESQIGYRKRLK